MAFIKRFISACFLLTATWIYAQPSQASKLEFTVFAYGSLPNGIKFEGPPGEVSSLVFKQSERSPTYSYSGSRSIVFFTETPGAPNQPAVRAKVASAVVPVDIKKALFFFVPGGAVDPYRIIVIEDSLDFFPAGSVRFFNASGFALKGIISDEQVVVNAGLSKVYSARKPLKVGLAMEHKGAYYPSFEQEFDLPKEQRLICLLLPPESPKTPLVRWALISDYIPLVEPAGK